MKITKEWLKKNNACTEGIEWFLSQRETGGIAVIRALVSAAKYDWAIWVISEVLKRKQKIQLAVFAAAQVLDIWEKESPEDKRPRIAIDAARVVLKNDNTKTRAAAWDAGAAACNAAGAAAWDAAGAAAGAAARAAVDAARAAWAAARAAWAAARAAWAAGAAARDAVDAAAGAAGAAAVDAWAAWDAGASMKIKIIEYGISLLEGA